MRLKYLFPRLEDENHTITSPVTQDYNCIAWGFGDDSRWWEPTDGYYWPDKVTYDYSLAALIEVAESEGYIETNNESPERGFDKIALYGKGDDYSHIARQLPNGEWTSKLGDLEDISHKSLDILEGAIYGVKKVIMKRKIKNKNK